jgi:hypothetical protein
MWRLCMIIVVVAITIACGVAVSGRIDVGERAATPCPQTE